MHKSKSPLCADAEALAQASGGQGVKRPSVETDGLNDCLPYEKTVDEFSKGLSSNFFIRELTSKVIFLLIDQGAYHNYFQNTGSWEHSFHKEILCDFYYLQSGAACPDEGRVLHFSNADTYILLLKRIDSC